MQSLVRRFTAVTRHHNHHHHHHHLQPNLTFNPHRISHTRPSTHIAQPSNLNHHIPSPSSAIHSWRSLSTKIRSSFSQSMIFRRNYLSSAKSIIDRSFPRVHFHRQNYISNWNNNSYRSGWRLWLNRLTPDDVVLGLIVANVAIFLFWKIATQDFMLNNFTISLDNIKSGRLHTLITNAFSHVDAWHLMSNMLGLYFFGLSIASKFGPEFLLKLYLAGAIGGSVFYLGHQSYKSLTSKGYGAIKASKDLALGASGAVNAVMLLNIFLNPRATIYLNFFIPVPAALLGIFLIGKDMLRIIEGDSAISGSAHLGGIAVAAIAWSRVRKGRF